MNALNPKHYVKAIHAALVVAYAMHIVSVTKESPGGEVVTLNELVAMAFAVTIAFVGTYVLPNSGSDNNQLPKG
jgi:hypothetical protein